VASSPQVKQAAGVSDRLYASIGDFLFANRLSVDPINYAFAHRVLSTPNGPLAAAVAQITDGGIRLTSRDIEELGGTVVAGAPAGEGANDDAAAEAAEGAMQVLVARTQMQVEGFADTVAAIRAETRGFGRDLEASAAAMRGGAEQAIDITRMATTMLDRVRAAEARLASANEEADTLRRELETARHDAKADPLTGLANRRAFEEAFEAASSSGAPICVALCDVDRFKSVNDRFGHAVGDRVLKVIAGALREACGEHLVARYGGEEFAVLFTGSSVELAAQTLDTAREAVAAKRYRLRETDAPLGAVTFSGGVSAHNEGELLGSVMGRADRLLYRAKDGGRNLIEREKA
jgi:diguanylate cyclase